MKPKAGRAVKAVGAAIAGATLGYVAGTLTAPASGRETRGSISRRVKDEAKAAGDKARRSLTTAKAEAGDLAQKARKSLTGAKDRLAERVHS